MFGIGMPELLVILAVALIVIGPKKLPDLARSLGKAMGEFKRATNDLKQSIEKETGLDEVRKDMRDVNKELRNSLTQGPSYPNVKATEESLKQSEAEAAADLSVHEGSDIDANSSEKDETDHPKPPGKTDQP